MNPINKNIQSLRQSFAILSKKDLRKVKFIIMFQVILGFLDLFGILAIGLLTSISIQKFSADESDLSLPGILADTPLQSLEFTTLAIYLAGFGFLLLISKTFISFFFTRNIINFFSYSAAQFSISQIGRLLSGSIELIQNKSFQHSIFAISRGVEVLFIQVLATVIVIISDFSLILVLTIGLLIIDFKTTLTLVIVFSVIGFFLFRFLNSRSRIQGSFVTEISLKSDEKIYEIFELFREMRVSGRQSYYLKELGKLRYSVAEMGSQLNFLPYVVKYVIELGFLLGVLIVGGIQFFVGDFESALQSTTMLIVSGSRLAPSLIRLQQGIVSIIAGLGQTRPTLNYFNELRNRSLVEDQIVTSSFSNTRQDFVPEISIKNLSFIYPNSVTPAINNLSLNIESGSLVAIVGPSGSGKSTLVDLILGILQPSSGSVTISGNSPCDCILKWPGALSYVPQDVSVIDGSIWENVTLGYSYSNELDSRVKQALNNAQLHDFASNSRLHSIENASEFKSKMSGGQRQRLGIARALFTNPSLMILDESTSALDASTENEIAQALENIRKDKTLIVIAHRLSTVMRADKVVYVSDGKILSVGTFDEVRSEIPEFDAQASLMGISKKD